MSCEEKMQTKIAAKEGKLCSKLLIKVVVYCAKYISKVHNTQLAFTCSKSTTETLEQCKICSELTIKATEQRQLRRSILFIVNFEQISRIVLVFCC